MSDEQIRQVFQNAEEWTPDNDNEDDSDSDVNSNGGSPGPNFLPPLQLGSDVEIASCVSQVLCQDRGEVIFSEGHVWYYEGSYWRSIDDHELRHVVYRYDGARPPGGRAVRLNKSRIDSILHETSAMLMRKDFFAEAPVGINCASGFIAFASDGTPRVVPHHPDHRCRHVLSAFFLDPINLDAEDTFSVSQTLGCLLGRLLEGVFLSDADAQQKRYLLAEIAGAAALGYRSKSWEPKAVILEGKTAENGKSRCWIYSAVYCPPTQ